MNFYKEQHTYYCGIDLHARKMYVCILDQKGKMKVHQNIETDGETFFELIFPYIENGKGTFYNPLVKYFF